MAESINNQTEAEQIAATATQHILSLLQDMFASSELDNEILLGELHSGNELIQVQLKVTRNQNDFMEELG